MTATVPTFDIDFFRPEILAEQHAHYATLRELGSVVWMPAHEIYAIPRYDEVREVLGDPDTFISGEGVGFNPVINEVTKGTTLASDGALHERRRTVVGAELRPKALTGRREGIVQIANDLVDDVLARPDVDGVRDLALAMPMGVVPDFLGLPQHDQENLMRWADAASDGGGPAGPDTERALGVVGEAIPYVIGLVENRELTPGSLGAGILEAADRGEIEMDECPFFLLDYIGPGLDTTATAIGHFLALFAQHPDQWTALRDEPGMVTSAINETLRFEGPFRGFTRVVARDAEIDGTVVPAGSRVWPLNASANRDDRKWGNGSEFDFRRNPIDHLAFGYGLHGCAGQGLARMEMHALVHALLNRVTRIELTGEPVYRVSSTMNQLASLPLALITD